MKTYNPNLLKTTSLALVGVLGFTACSGRPSTDKNPVDRFSYDYVSFLAHNGGVDCFRGTAYDTDAGERGRASSTPPSTSYDKDTGIFTVTPVSGKDPLKVEGFDQNDHRVTPVDSGDQAIFDSYGCEPKGY